MATIDFKGVAVEYDADSLDSWAVQKKIAQQGFAAFEALDIVLMGRSDEIAEQVGGKMSDMTDLITAILAWEGKAKNSRRSRSAEPDTPTS